MKIKPTSYKLQSIASGKVFEDSGWLLDSPVDDKHGLIRAVYENKQLNIGPSNMGLYKFSDWLPIKKALKGSYAPITFKSKGLAKELGMSNLYITFSGYWPEKGIEMTTCSFKETEAFSVCGRKDNHDGKVLVVASAGNTARAFARVCSDNNIPLLLFIPEDNLNALWFDKPINDTVKVVASEKGGDYFDAIHLSNLAVELDMFVPEGGAKNVARRDGMGTTVLSAVTEIGEIPEYYFQAIGSGTGAIAAWEANLRFLEDGRFGNRKMKLMVSQNFPFHPIYDAWKANSRQMLLFDHNMARRQVEEIDAKVLSNRKPPYPPAGGLYDALMDAGGDVLLANNKESAEAASLFEKCEGIDIHPAAGVATATLIKTVTEGVIDRNALTMLNITGGGEKRIMTDKEVFYLKPDLVLPLDPDEKMVHKELQTLFKI
ncbi:MAG: cysteate synthase [Marinilabiliales bacterium]|nr:MAG: cysteate synthase [Marinilabiliales bacterium]